MKMKKLVIACVLGMSCVTVKADAVPKEFVQAFAAHQQIGTLLNYKTPVEFQEKGWGTFYHDAIADNFKGESVEGLRLEVKPSEGYTPKVGNKIALDFYLYNDSDKEVAVTTGGSCKTVHQAGYMMIIPNGELWQSIGRSKVGGPHCFCEQNSVKLPAHSSVKLETRTDSDVVVGVAPSEAGKYVIIGTYDMATQERPERRILSASLEINITK
jgi:hypothetical protein